MVAYTHAYPGGVLAGPDVFKRELRRLMKARGLTAYALAKRAGLTRQSVGYILNGDREPNWTTVRKLARALGVSVEAFDVGEPKGMPSPEEAEPGKPGRPPGGRRRKKGGRP
jgi:transcriptional regulator with XRE-family HTH domain